MTASFTNLIQSLWCAVQKQENFPDGVLAGKLIADEITDTQNPWAKLYNPSRLSSIFKSLPSMLSHDLQINAQYKRFAQSDIKDIEDLLPGDGGVLNPTGSKPVACYKDDQGKVHKFSAVCPHMKGSARTVRRRARTIRCTEAASAKTVSR